MTDWQPPATAMLHKQNKQNNEFILRNQMAIQNNNIHDDKKQKNWRVDADIFFFHFLLRKWWISFTRFKFSFDNENFEKSPFGSCTHRYTS